jgi:nucleoid-associated protein YgaU
MKAKTLWTLIIVIMVVTGLALLFLLPRRLADDGTVGTTREKRLSDSLQSRLSEEKARQQPLPVEQDMEAAAEPTVPPVLKREVVPAEEQPESERPVCQREGKPKVLTHRVAPGECLWSIAGQDSYYGEPLKWVWIYAANYSQILDPDLIYPDQELSLARDETPELKENPYERVVRGSFFVPSGKEGGRQYPEHVVLWSESLWKIAGYKKYYGRQTQWVEIFEANKDKINDPDLIFPKQRLKIPLQ